MLFFFKVFSFIIKLSWVFGNGLRLLGLLDLEHDILSVGINISNDWLMEYGSIKALAVW